MSEAGASVVDTKFGLGVVPKTMVLLILFSYIFICCHGI